MDKPPTVRGFRCHPTLEPALVPGNEEAVGAALGAMGVTLDPVTASAVDALFQGTARKRKGEFSLELAAVFAERLQKGQSVFVPDVIRAMFDYLYDPPAPPAVPMPAPSAPPAPADDDAPTAD